eukprot:gene4367-20589_t
MTQKESYSLKSAGEDQIKIIKEEELDYCLGSTQDTDEDSELPKSMVDLILERNENLTDMSPDWKKDSMQDFLKYLTDSGIEPDGNKTELEENMTHMQESNKDDEVSVEDTDPEPTLIRQSTTRTRNKRSRGGRQVPGK